MPSCEYFLGILAGKGIKFYLPPAADMLKANRLYGYENATEFEQRMKYRRKDLNNELRGMQQQLEQLRATVDQYRGAIEENKFACGMLER